jgi:hypothetical protein
MKRSEALKRIKEYIDINAGFLVPEQVLNICQGLGMLPPKMIKEIIIPESTEYDPVERGMVTEEAWTINNVVNEWEPEDGM